MMHDLAGYTPFAGRKLRGWRRSPCYHGAASLSRMANVRWTPAPAASWHAAAAGGETNPERSGIGCGIREQNFSVRSCCELSIAMCPD